MTESPKTDLSLLACDQCGKRDVGRTFICGSCGFDMLARARERGQAIVESRGIEVPIHKMSWIQKVEADLVAWRKETGGTVPPLARVALLLGVSEEEAVPFLRAAIKSLEYQAAQKSD